ncbi:MAG: twin-arginine translocation signal domain-containing protein [Candidatus Aminicenantes bacterium]|nr:twin-arginine translocation signal domain-containing protein [Candidatus Aminicenantes bacterium]
MDQKKKNSEITRREFIKASSAAALVAAIPASGIVYGQESGRIRAGMIGCGGRGTGAALNCVKASSDVVITAMGDLFEDQLKKSYKRLSENLPKDHLAVTKDTMFTGFDAFQKVLASDIDMVIMASPPHFRPLHLKAAVEAGKHVFMEKPVAVDPAGIRSVIASSGLAETKNLSIVAGTQRRHQDHYLEVMKRIHSGDIGEIVAGQCYWNQGGLWVERAMMNWVGYKTKNWSDMEWQIRNWLFVTWLSGDHIVEQHVHNLDVMNWAVGSHPVECSGMGGRQVRTEPQYGNIFDHFAVEYVYPNGARVMSQCRQTPGCSSNVSERVMGTKGVSFTSGGEGRITGAHSYEHTKESPNPYVQEHADLIASIKTGKPLNEARRVAESTLTAIMGRISAYTGRALKWEWVMNSSKLDLSPPAYDFIDLPLDPVAVPGETPLI